MGSFKKFLHHVDIEDVKKKHLEEIAAKKLKEERQKEEQEKRESQRSAVNFDRLSADDNNFRRSVAASNDDYMRSALEQVRKDTRTHSDSVTRLNGTYMFNKTLDNNRDR